MVHHAHHDDVRDQASTIGRRRPFIMRIACQHELPDNFATVGFRTNFCVPVENVQVNVHRPGTRYKRHPGHLGDKDRFRLLMIAELDQPFACPVPEVCMLDTRGVTT